MRTQRQGDKTPAVWLHVAAPIAVVLAGVGMDVTTVVWSICQHRKLAGLDQRLRTIDCETQRLRGSITVLHANRNNPFDRYRPYRPDAPTMIFQGPDPRPEIARMQAKAREIGKERDGLRSRLEAVPKLLMGGTFVVCVGVGYFLLAAIAASAASQTGRECRDG